MEDELFKDIRKQKIMVATPCYGGVASAFYTRSMIHLSAMCTANNIELHYFFLPSESLITRARNYCADEFMRSGCTHLVFIDADIEFNPSDVLTLVAYASEDSDRDIVCGPYPLKDIAWEKIKYAVDKGHADKDPDNLINFSVDYVFNVDKGVKNFNIGELLKVSESGTGFMCIQKRVFDKFKAAHPELEYLPDHTKSADFNGERTIMAYFNTPIDPESRRYLSEDYYFCREIAKLDMNVYVCPWMKLNHIGTYRFVGNLAEQARIGLSYGVMKGILK